VVDLSILTSLFQAESLADAIAFTEVTEAETNPDPVEVLKL
jgi:hypothetical protein